MHRPITTRRILEGRWHFPIDLFDFEKFRSWRHSDRCSRSIKASYIGGMVYIETGLDWSVHYPKWGDADGYRFSPTFQHRFRIVRRSDPIGRYSYRLLHWKSESP